MKFDLINAVWGPASFSEAGTLYTIGVTTTNGALRAKSEATESVGSR